MGADANALSELDGPSLLTQLIDWAERLLYRAARTDQGFADLSAAIIHSRNKRHGVGDEATMLLTALWHLDDQKDAARWRMIAFVLLEQVKAASLRLMEERREAAMRSDPEAQPTYRGGHR